MPSSHRHSRLGFAADPVTRGLLCATTLTMALSMSVAVAMAAKDTKAKPKDNKPKDPAAEEESNSFLSGNELFPDNSVLKGVILPTYDEKLQLTNTLTAEEMTIVTKQNIEARNLKIDFFGDDRTPRGTMTMTKSAFDAPKNLLVTDEPVTFASDDLNVDGSAMSFDTKNNRGYLHGPVTAVMRPSPKKPAATDPKAKATGTAAPEKPKEATAPPEKEKEAEPAPAPPVATADALKGLTPDEKFAALELGAERLQQIKADLTSRAPQAAEACARAERSLEENEKKVAGARITMGKFLTLAALTLTEADTTEEPDGPLPRPESAPLLAGMEKTTITSEGGAFMDNTAGLTVFMKNVKVVNPELTLTAKKEVKAFMKVDPATDGKTKEEARAEMQKRFDEKAAARKAAEKNGTANPDGQGQGGGTTEPAPTLPKPPEGTVKPDKPQATPEQLEKWKEDKDKKKSGGLGDSGDISRLVASGTVLIDYKPKPEIDKDGKEVKKDPMKAAAHMVIYDFEKEEVLLQGGSPWVTIGPNLCTVNGDDAYIQVLLKDGQPVYAVAKNGSLTTSEFQTKDKKDGDKDKDKGKDKPADKPQGANKPAGGDNKPQGGSKPPGSPRPANNRPTPNHR